MFTNAFVFDFNYRFRPDWQPPDCPIAPWFLFPDPRDAGKPLVFTWDYALRYRAEKIAFVRRPLTGVDRSAVLREIVRRVWDGARDDDDRFCRLIGFVQRMMAHLMAEQPVEADALTVCRRECAPPTAQADAYPEDLICPWLTQAYTEARAFGRHLGVWCNPMGTTLTGDWGMAGVVHDALELLCLHEGRCGHQACVTVQLAQAGGWRARLTQLFHHRVAEVYVNNAWRLADADEWAPGFIGRTGNGDLATVDWCAAHRDTIRHWPLAEVVRNAYDYAYHFQSGM